MKNSFNKYSFDHGNAICYSGFRDGQSPETGIFPTYEEIKEDLLILQGHWKYLRLYDCDPHSKTVLKVIEDENLDFKVMLGAYIEAEESNHNCPWGGVYDEETLKLNKEKNRNKILKLISFAKRYPEIIFSLSVGNEATVEWTDHMVPVESVIDYVRMVKAEVDHPVTFCENYLPWIEKLELLVEEVDFISIHTYPVWEYKSIDEAMDYTQQNFWDVANKYPHKPIVITEAGWTTNSNGRGIEPDNTGEELQHQYCVDLMDWTNSEKILTFVFEAFDENWKGSDDPLEPEKHWGLYRVDRSPKLIAKNGILQNENVNL